MSYPHGGLRTGRLGPPSTVQVGHPLRCGLVDAGAQVGPLVLRRGAVCSRLRCASAGCLLLRHSLSASSALSSSFVTILSLISSHSPGLSTAKVRKTWRSPQVCSLRSSSRSAWSNILTMVIGRLPLTFGASSRCLKYCSIHSRAGRSLSCRSAFPRKSNLLTMISFRRLVAPDVSYSLQLLMRSGQRIFSKQRIWRLWAASSFCKPASVSTVASML